MSEYTLAKFTGDTKQRTPVNMLEGRTTIQRDLERLQELGQQKPYKIQQGRIPRPVPGNEEPSAVREAGANGMGSSSAERQVDSELNMRQQSTLATEEATGFQERGQET